MDPASILRAISALVFVLALLLGMAWLGRRYGGKLGLAPVSASGLRIVETRPLDARRKLVVVAWDGREHLLSMGPGGDCLIASRTGTTAPPPEPPASQPAPPAWLQALLKRKDAGS